MLWIATGRECIGLRVGGDGECRHREPGTLPETIDHRIQLRRLLRRHDARAVGSQRDLRRGEIGNEVHDAGDQQRHDHTTLPPDRLPDREQQRGHAGHQNEDLQVSHCPLTSKKARPPLARRSRLVSATRRTVHRSGAVLTMRTRGNRPRVATPLLPSSGSQSTWEVAHGSRRPNLMRPWNNSMSCATSRSSFPARWWSSYSLIASNFLPCPGLSWRGSCLGPMRSGWSRNLTMSRTWLRLASSCFCSRLGSSFASARCGRCGVRCSRAERRRWDLRLSQHWVPPLRSWQTGASRCFSAFSSPCPARRSCSKCSATKARSTLPTAASPPAS